MKKLLCVLLALAMVLSMAACGSKADAPAADAPAADTAEDDGKVKVGLCIAGMTMPYYVRMYEGFVAAAEAKGWEVIFADGGADPEATLKAMEDLLANDVDAIAVSTNQFEALADPCATAQERGIPIFYIGNLQLPENVLQYMTFWEGTVSEDAGYLGGLWVGDYLDSIGYKKDLKIVQVSLIHDSLQQRYTGFEKGLVEKGFTVEMVNIVGDLTRENSLAGSEDMLIAHDDIDIFYGTAGTSALGAYDATQNSGRTEVMVVGFDGEDEEIQHVDEGGNYIATICQDPVGESEVTVEAIATVLAGGTVEGGHETPAKVYGAGVGYVTADELLG